VLAAGQITKALFDRKVKVTAFGPTTP